MLLDHPGPAAFLLPAEYILATTGLGVTDLSKVV
jgi:hypothetical protein